MRLSKSIRVGPWELVLYKPLYSFKYRHMDNVIRRDQFRSLLRPLFPKPSAFFLHLYTPFQALANVFYPPTDSTHMQLVRADFVLFLCPGIISFLQMSHSDNPLNISLFDLQGLCRAPRASPSWDTTTAQCPRPTQAFPAWSGQSFRIMWCSIRDEGWGTTASAGTQTESPTPGVSSDRTQGPSAGLTATATRVRP